MATVKVFVGNLVFTTTDEELKTAFSAAANVLSANVICRGRRSLGYGFVEFANEADAQKAVDALNQKDIGGRPINVEVARARDPAKEEEAKAKRVAKPRAPRAPSAEGSPTQTEGGASGDARGPRRTGRGRPRRGPRADGSSPVASSSNAASSPSDGSAAPRARRQPQPRRQRTPAEARPFSETTLFVANVPFATNDEQLREFFAEFKPKAAHIVRMRNGRSRGYGFVEFDNETQQKAGLAVHGKQVAGPNNSTMELSVKVAMTPPPISASPEASSSPAVTETKA